MARQILAGAVGLLVALILLMLGVWFQLRFTTIGAFIWTANHATSEEVVRRFPHPLAAVSTAVMVSTWLLFPIAASLSAAVARLIARRTTWPVSITVAVPFAVFPLMAAFGVSAIGASCVYILAAYGGMKAVDVAQRPRQLAQRSHYAR